MDFNVKFIGSEEVDTEINILESKKCSLGLDIIDDVRKTFNLTEEQLPLDQIYDNTSCSKLYKLTCKLTEEQVRASGNAFKQNNSIKVLVPKDFLTPYQDLDYKLRNNPLCRLTIFGFTVSTTYETDVEIKTKILEGDIIKDWQKAGCPLKWGFKG